MTGHGGVSASTYLVVVVVNVALAIALIIPFGLNGAAVASAIALALRAFWLALRGAAAARRQHLDLRRRDRRICARYTHARQRRSARRPNRRSVAGEEEEPAPVRRDADAEERVGAVGLHVLVVGGGEQREELDELLRASAPRADTAAKYGQT